VAGGRWHNAGAARFGIIVLPFAAPLRNAVNPPADAVISRRLLIVMESRNLRNLEKLLRGARMKVLTAAMREIDRRTIEDGIPD